MPEAENGKLEQTVAVATTLHGDRESRRLCEGGVDVVGVLLSLFAEVRRFCMAIRLSSSVCCSKCMRRKKRERMVKDRSK